MLCEESGYPHSTLIKGATSIQDCETACLENPDCTSVVDYFWLKSIRGCFLFSGACCGAAPLPAGDFGRASRKVCD
jgi:hypothetical protein